jgi:diguanylate cyclase (GGDEF)-like protein/PAS domain S-box-containing protein
MEQRNPDSGRGTLELAVEALLREHPDSYVCAVAENGLIVPMPGTITLSGQRVIEGRSLIDFVVAEERNIVLEAWNSALSEGAATLRTRLANDPDQEIETRIFDLRAAHGIILAIILPPQLPQGTRGRLVPAGEDVEGDSRREGGQPELLQVTPAQRYCVLQEDEGGNVIGCDEDFGRMFGYAPEEIVGRGVLDHIHPEDRGRAVEAWLQMLSTRRDQYYRCRRLHCDGHWMWVDSTLRNFLQDPERGYVLVELVDVSSEMRAEEALREREELLSRLTEAMPVGLLQVDQEGEVVYQNAHLREVIGSPAARAGQRCSLSELLGPLTLAGMSEFRTALQGVLERGADRDIEVDAEPEPDRWRRVLFAMRSLHREQGAVRGAIICALDVTDRARARIELERRATFDSLTRCYNREEILARLDKELASGSPTGLVYVDLDDFKPVNDRFGHSAGDELLQLVAERLRAASRRADDVGRMGGDEFIVLMRNVRSAQGAMRSARRIANSLSGRYHTTFGSVSVCAAIGVACAGLESEAQGAKHARKVGAQELVALADEAMYESKGAALGAPVLAAKQSAPGARKRRAAPARAVRRQRARPPR